MDTTSPYLRIKILEWKQQLQRTSLTAEDREEISAHLEDIIYELCQTELMDDEIWIIATKRIGTIVTIETEFEKVNPDLESKKTGMVLTYGAVLMLLFQMMFVLAPVYLFREYQALNHLVSFWPILFYGLGGFIGLMILICIFKGSSIIRSLKSLFGASTMVTAFLCLSITIFSGFLLIQLIDFGRLDHSGTTAPSFKALTQLFFFSQIMFIGYFLLSKNRDGIRNLLSFNRKINWKRALFLGACAGLAVTFAFTYPVKFFPLIIGCPLFAGMGWMFSFSKKPFTNLFFGQLFLMGLTFSEVSGMHALLFGSYYLIIIVTMVVCMYLAKAFGSPSNDVQLSH